MKKPPLNKFFKARCLWSSFSTDGDRRERGPDDIIGIRYGPEEYSFIHKGQAYLHEKIYTEDIGSWELLENEK